MSSCATSAPLDLATDSTDSLKTLEQTVVADYPVTRQFFGAASGARSYADAELTGALQAVS